MSIKRKHGGKAERCKPELLAPAGGPDAGYAALHFGADAVYLGLNRFSARADADNFTPESLSEFTAYAHSLTPARRVYLTLNTLIKQAELPAAAELMAVAADVGVDALIVQDMGVLHLARACYPQLRLHASTQLAIHNLAGALAARRMGFQRVTLARELALPEITRIAAESGVEIEAFAHGALCYSYSGLCLFSSHLTGRSGNRGRCAYLCRDGYKLQASLRADGEGDKAFVFSMKDLALPEMIPQLCRAGVRSLKIEGRKKSPLYVAMVTRLYRRLLDGPVSAEELRSLADDVRVVFSRPWTGLFIASAGNPDVIERDMMGHRGCLTGRVTAVKRRSGGVWLAFKTGRALELHDGIQIDLPNQSRPYGFAVSALRRADGAGGGKLVRIEAGMEVETLLPGDHPSVPLNAPVYCSSSQAVKLLGRFKRPRPGVYRVRHPVRVVLTVGRDGLLAIAHDCRPDGVGQVEVELACACEPARSGAMAMPAARAAFERMNDTDWRLDDFEFHNKDALFVPISALKTLRRRVVDALDDLCAKAISNVLPDLLKRTLSPLPVCSVSDWVWSLKTDQPGCLADFTADDWRGLDELILDIDALDSANMHEQLNLWSSRLGRERIRLALPVVNCDDDNAGLHRKFRGLLDAGWQRWEIANLYGLELLTGDMPVATDIAADWSLYVLNNLAAVQLREAGVSRVTLSPEDDIDNWRELLPVLPLPAVAVVYQDTPLMISAACISRTAHCAGRHGCREPDMELLSAHGDHLRVCRRGCRNILINEKPLSMVSHRDTLLDCGINRVRADFLWRTYAAAETRRIWRALRAGRDVTTGHSANLTRGLI